MTPACWSYEGWQQGSDDFLAKQASPARAQTPLSIKGNIYNLVQEWMMACRHGELGAVETLLAAGAKVKLLNKRGLSPLGEALAGGKLSCAAALVAGGADTSADSGFKPGCSI